MKTKQIFSSVILAILGGFIALFVYTRFLEKKNLVITERLAQPVGMVKLTQDENSPQLDFTYAAEKSIHAVVNVRTETMSQTARNPLYELFYGERYSEPEPVLGIGSGVIISDNGYIVTNNHVVDNSDKIYVTLNDKREFEAQVIGTDPSTDLALLKIKSEDLPHIPFGDSDNLRVGEWVLAVGNPFNLTSTVTAGIVSAKGKNLGIIQDQYRMESFIQTDAAVNRGNSGGALVDLRGNLVGINTAIISPSGGYAGISFAVPVSIVEKVVSDLQEFGVVQRAILGVTIADVTSQLAKDEGLDKIEGVYVTDVREDGAAKSVGIEKGDLILEINGVSVNSPAELQEQISKYSPNDKVSVLVKRKSKTKLYEATLRNLQGNTNYVKTGSYDSILGARFAEVDHETRKKLGIKNGLQVTDLRAGKLRTAGVKEGFIVTQINKVPVNTIEDVNKIINEKTGGIFIEGIYPDGSTEYYAFGL
ncbi:MAG: Do family serine endopeptidase [Bacteroidales bacterium]|nr:Do family serine endopeptidase [Bacteroidales bacterium]